MLGITLYENMYVFYVVSNQNQKSFIIHKQPIMTRAK